MAHRCACLVLFGGVPLKLGNEVIGAIGVGGARGGDKDEACSDAASARSKTDCADPTVGLCAGGA